MVEIIIAFGLDLVFGDPVYAGHPVRVIGRAIERTEKGLRSLIRSEKLAGSIQAVLIPLFTFASVWYLAELAGQFYPVLKRIVSIYFLYSAIAVKDLESEARKIYTCLVNKKLEEGRKNLSRIAGRDTKDLAEEEVIRGTVESVAESFVDGILSPLFYAALGGAPLAMAYKAINTLDSMVARKTPRYARYGFAAAKLDEWANWVPARISWLLIGVAAALLNGRYRESWYTGWKDGANTSFPNSVVPEAAFAGALGIQLGGVNFYGGTQVETPKMGYPMRSIGKDDIRRAYKLMKVSSWISLGFAVILSYLVSQFFVRIVNPLGS